MTGSVHKVQLVLESVREDLVLLRLEVACMQADMMRLKQWQDTMDMTLKHTLENN